MNAPTPWITIPRAARLIGESEDIIREKVRLGIIAGRNVALPGRRPTWRTTVEALAAYQHATEALPSTPPATAIYLEDLIPTEGKTLVEWETAVREGYRQLALDPTWRPS